jgi:uncharacterized protein YfaP (DUF2135 family)
LHLLTHPTRGRNRPAAASSSFGVRRADAETLAAISMPTAGWTYQFFLWEAYRVSVQWPSSSINGGATLRPCR